jgi:hypothetical protein
MSKLYERILTIEKSEGEYVEFAVIYDLETSHLNVSSSKTHEEFDTFYLEGAAAGADYDATCYLVVNPDNKSEFYVCVPWQQPLIHECCGYTVVTAAISMILDDVYGISNVVVAPIDMNTKYGYFTHHIIKVSPESLSAMMLLPFINTEQHCVTKTENDITIVSKGVDYEVTNRHEFQPKLGVINIKVS